MPGNRAAEDTTRRGCNSRRPPAPLPHQMRRQCPFAGADVTSSHAGPHCAAITSGAPIRQRELVPAPCPSHRPRADTTYRLLRRCSRATVTPPALRSIHSVQQILLSSPAPGVGRRPHQPGDDAGRHPLGPTRQPHCAAVGELSAQSRSGKDIAPLSRQLSTAAQQPVSPALPGRSVAEPSAMMRFHLLG